MLEVTNNHELPEQILRLAIEADQEGIEPVVSNIKDIQKLVRVTELISSPQKWLLSKRYGKRMDIADMINILLGRAYHEYFSQRNSNEVSEQRTTKDYKGWQITGQFDLFLNDDTLIDHKVSSVWTYTFRRFESYEKQLNVYNWLNDFKAKKLKVWLVMRDWSQSKVGGNYPTIPFAEIDIPVWTQKKTLEYLDAQIQRFNEILTAPVTEQVFCNQEEQMLRKKYSINGKSFSNLEGARGAIKYALDHGFTEDDIKPIYTGYPQCLNYCPVRHVCPQSRLVGTTAYEEEVTI
jgi:hypothetical protein